MRACRRQAPLACMGVAMDGNHWTVFNGAGAVVCDNMPMEVAQAYLTAERAERGWNAVYCLIVRDPAEFPSGVGVLKDKTVSPSPPEQKHGEVPRGVPGGENDCG
jgi:hypothetical protein